MMLKNTHKFEVYLAKKNLHESPRRTLKFEEGMICKNFASFYGYQITPHLYLPQ